MPRSPRYYMLMASLPPLPPFFTSDQTPISRLRLDRRLSMLEPDDREELAALEDLMRWDRLPLDITDQEIIERANENNQGYAPWLWFGDTEFPALDMNEGWDGPLTSWGNSVLPLTGSRASIFE